MHCASIVLALLAALRAGGYKFSHIFSRFASTSNDSNASTIIVLFTQSISYRVVDLKYPLIFVGGDLKMICHGGGQ